MQTSAYAQIMNLTFERTPRSLTFSRSHIGNKLGLPKCYNMSLVRSLQLNRVPKYGPTCVFDLFDDLELDL